MKKRFTEEQTISAVKKLESGVPAKDLSREMGVTQQTLYHWKKRFGGWRSRMPGDLRSSSPRTQDQDED